MTPISTLPKNQRRPANKPSHIQDFHWNGQGDFEFEIVGESFYQRELANLVGKHGDDYVSEPFVATLLLDDSNRHDPKAVAVQINGKKIGHLSRDDARSYRRRLGQKALTGVNATCDALIVGGGIRKNGGKMLYGVKLDIKPFE